MVDAALIRSGEARKLDEMADSLQANYVKHAEFVVKDKKTRVTGPLGLFDAVLDAGRKGVAMQRYKGLGEMKSRPALADDAGPGCPRASAGEDAAYRRRDLVFSTLMGDVVEPRRDFIVKNALKVANLDV